MDSFDQRTRLHLDHDRHIFVRGTRQEHHRRNHCRRPTFSSVFFRLLRWHDQQCYCLHHLCHRHQVRRSLC